MTWITNPPEHKCNRPSVEGRREGEWWICPECDTGYPVHEHFDGTVSFGIGMDRRVWMFHTRESRPKKWWGR